MVVSVMVASLSPSFAADAGDEPMATVEISAQKPGYTFAVITGRAVASGVGGSASAVAWEDVCITPCTAQITPGLREVLVYGKGSTASRLKLTLTETEPIKLEARQGPVWARYAAYGLAVGGATVALLGGLGMSDPCFSFDTEAECRAKRTNNAVMLGGGIAAVGVAVPLFVVGGSKLERVQ